MSNIINITARACAVIAGVFIVVAAASADVMPSDWRQKLSDEAWEQNLRAATFQDREIFEDAEQNVLEVKAPYRAEDAALTPISIHTRFPQTDELYVQRMHVFIDKNPVPLVGIFDFTPDSGKADLAMRVRVNDHTYVRVIAELNNGELHMGKSFVRAMGACSAVRPPEQCITTLNCGYNWTPIMKAQLTWTISIAPSLRFFFGPETEGWLTVEATDTKNARWSSEFAVN